LGEADWLDEELLRIKGSMTGGRLEASRDDGQGDKT